MERLTVLQVLRSDIIWQNIYFKLIDRVMWIGGNEIQMTLLPPQFVYQVEEQNNDDNGCRSHNGRSGEHNK